MGVWPLCLAPLTRVAEDGSRNRICDVGVFGLLPHFATEIAYGRRTYNARSETVAELRSFKHAWAAGQRCIVPAELIYEPCWEAGKAFRLAIQMPGQVPMGIAGIYRAWRAPDGRQLFTFAMLTVNADGHPVMQRFHRPEDEKRMVVILREQDYGSWLSCRVDEAPAFFRRWEGPLEAYPAPLPPRAPSSSSVRSRKLPQIDAGDDGPGLF